ncbi:hypothetical protein [Streptomyces justiciae]|uniref:hypothetical protein n=1 Tax=Streptomyces justiciae TaxID=2780140 RepID=UPI0018828094|nr:hypothetical protein [Streptomyces justiciae]MBE8476169.1 hypothetical protein [Streptomyces justiciae]
MAVDQLPGCIREFVNYLDGLLARLDQGGGWCAVFWQRDPEGMQACLEGREVPPWDVVEALLQDLATEYGPAVAAPEVERARALHAEALAAYDARPGARDALGDRLDVMLREQRYAAERQAELGHLLATAATREAADAIRLDLAWARDDHERATARCTELRTRMADLDRRTGGGQAQVIRRGQVNDGAVLRVGDEAGGARAGGTGQAGLGGARASGGGVGQAGPGAGQQPGRGPYGGGPSSMPQQRDARTAAEAGATGWPTQAARETGPGGAPGSGGGGAGQEWHERAAADGPRDAWQGPAGQGWQAGARTAAQGVDGDVFAGGVPVFADQRPERPGARTAAQSSGPGGFPADSPGAAGQRHWQAPAPTADARHGLGDPANVAADSPSGPGTPEGAHGPGAVGGQAEAPSAGSGPATNAAPTPKQRKRRRGSARFAGMVEEDAAPVVVPPAAAPTLPAQPATGRRTPRGARFAGAGAAVEAPEPQVERLDNGDRREVAQAVEQLVRLRREGRSGEAHALLVDAAYWPAARFPLLAAELQHAGLGADWATLLWEAASLPAERLVAAADALVEAGRGTDGEQVLRQGVVRPAEEIGQAVLGLVHEGRRREVRALLDAYVRVRTPEEAARSAAPGPQTLVPLLLEASQGVSEERHWDLVHALRVAGFTA